MPRAAPHDLRRLSDRLRALSLQPGEQAAFAAEIIRDVRDGALLNSALAVLGAHPVREAHDALAEVYAYLAASPEKRDAGGYLRMAAVNALRPIAALSDLAIFERAATTYEFSVQERGSPTVLRAAGLVALNQLDARLAGQYAARLLAERDRMSDMNGEPARTRRGRALRRWARRCRSSSSRSKAHTTRKCSPNPSAPRWIFPCRYWTRCERQS